MMTSPEGVSRLRQRLNSAQLHSKSEYPAGDSSLSSLEGDETTSPLVRKSTAGALPALRSMDQLDDTRRPSASISQLSEDFSLQQQKISLSRNFNTLQDDPSSGFFLAEANARRGAEDQQKLMETSVEMGYSPSMKLATFSNATAHEWLQPISVLCEEPSKRRDDVKGPGSSQSFSQRQLRGPMGGSYHSLTPSPQRISHQRSGSSNGLSAAQLPPPTQRPASGRPKTSQQPSPPQSDSFHHCFARQKEVNLVNTVKEVKTASVVGRSEESPPSPSEVLPHSTQVRGRRNTGRAYVTSLRQTSAMDIIAYGKPKPPSHPPKRRPTLLLD